MATRLYDGTSAYKLDTYEEYNRKAQEQQQKRQAQVKKHRAVNFKKLSIILGVTFAIAIAFLYTNALLIQTSSKVSELNKELEDIKVRNTQVSFDIASGVDYKEVEQKAITEFGMQHPESYQNVYVDVVQNDFVELSQAPAESKGVIQKLISNIQSFLAYIK